MVQDGGNIGCNKIFPFPDSGYQRRSVAYSHNLLRLICTKNGARIDSSYLTKRQQNGRFQIASIVFFDQMSEDFSVGLRRKGVLFRLQTVFQLEIIFDDAVMYHDDTPLAVPVRVGVLLSGASVCGPPGVTN